MADPTLNLQASVEDLKLIYRVLHRHLAEHLELMDSAFFERLQAELQKRAKSEGVDPTNHGAWDAWLGNAGAPTCDERVARRQLLS